MPREATARKQQAGPRLGRYAMIDVGKLKPYPRNARTHSQAQIGQIARSIQEFGFTNPLLVDGSNEIIAGHGRLDAAKAAGMASVPCIVLEGLTPAQKRALVIADNQLALNAGWDFELLSGEIQALRELDFDLDLTGFSTEEIDRFLGKGSDGLTDPDEIPDPPAEQVAKLGDVWILGRHRLVCGDATDPEMIERLMKGKEADLCFTSPPYAQQRDYKTGAMDWDALMRGVFSILPVKEEAQILVNLGLVHRSGEWMPYWDGWIEWMREAGWRRFGWYVWDQGPGMAGDWNGRLAPSHEFVFHFNRVAERARKTKDKRPENIKLADRHRGGMRRKDGQVSGRSNVEASLAARKIPDSVIRVMRHKARGIEVKHPAVFPVDLPGEFINAFSDPDELVFEPFCGSGTQLIAAQKNGRSCYACEIAPVYVDVAVKRWEAFTGQKAKRE